VSVSPPKRAARASPQGGTAPLGRPGGRGSSPVNAARGSVLEMAGLSIALPRGSDRAHAVNGVSLTVAPGEIVCLVGESGSGKSVIAHATMGLLPRALEVTGGAIRLAGEDLVGAPEKRLEELRCTRMAMIFQEPMTALNPVMRCGDQIDEVLRRHTRLDAEARRAKVLEGLRDVRLPEPERMASSYPHQLSGGQRQRIMIAMALVLDPKLLIADEPTTALDVTTQAQILALVRDLMREHGTGVLFITHDFGVVAEIADRVAVLKHGELVELGAAGDVLHAPKHDYTKMLIASVPSMTPRHRAVVDTPPLVETRGLSAWSRTWRTSWRATRTSPSAVSSSASSTCARAACWPRASRSDSRPRRAARATPAARADTTTARCSADCSACRGRSSTGPSPPAPSRRPRRRTPGQRLSRTDTTLATTELPQG